MLLSIAVCGGAAAALAWTQPPTYAAHTQMFVSTSARPGSLGQTYQGGLFIQQRVASYTSILSSAIVVQRVINQLGLRDSVPAVQSEISASVPVGTVLINATVRDRTPSTAKAIAIALDDQFSGYVSDLESRQTGGQPSVKVSVISPATLPTTPVSPRKSLDVALGVIIGLVLGTIGAVALEALDDRIRGEEDVVSIAEAPVIGSIVKDPNASAHPLVVLEAPDSPAAEPFRRLRTNVQVLARDRATRSFVVTSARPGEGKTLVAANLGLAFAQAGYRVLMVNADLRRPRLGKIMGASSMLGLSSVLEEKASIEDALHADPRLSLELLDSGPLPPRPGEMLESGRFLELMNELAARADIVLVDAPALLAVADATIIAKSVAAMIMVARVGSTRRAELETAVRSLGMVDTPVLGVVLNCVSPRDLRPFTRFADAARGAPTSGRRAVRTERLPHEAVTVDPLDFRG